MWSKLKNRNLDQNLPWVLVVGGAIGLLSAFILTLEKFALLKDPSHQLSCSLNPVLSCGSIINSDQASAFGFPNPILGLVGFSVVITIGMGLLAKAKYSKWFWQGLLFFATLGVIFVHWLIFQSLYNLEALCIYCMVVWAVTIPIFWYTKLYCIQKGFVKGPKAAEGISAFAQKHHADVLILWYLIIIALILQKFWYYWSTLI